MDVLPHLIETAGAKSSAAIAERGSRAERKEEQRGGEEKEAGHGGLS